MKWLRKFVVLFVYCLSRDVARCYAQQAEPFLGEPCNLAAPVPQMALQQFETLLNNQFGTCTPYKGTFCEGILNPGDYVYVHPKTIVNALDPSVRGNLTYLTAYLEQHWNFSRLLGDAQSPTCKQIMQKALCTYYYPVCRNASGNVTVLHTICSSNCDYIAQDLCPTDWAKFYHLSLMAPQGFNLKFNCTANSPMTVPPMNPYCCINVAPMPASTSSSTLSPSTAFSPSMAPSPSTTPTTTEVFQIPTAVLPTFNYTEASSVSLLTSTASSLVPAYVSRMEATATSTIVGATAAAFVIAVLVLGGVGVAIVLSNRRQKRLRRQATRMRLLSGRPSNDPSNSGEFQPTPNPYLISAQQVHLTLNGSRMVKVPSNYLRHLSGKMLIPEHCLQLLDCIGQGEFGIVYRAYLRDWAKYPSPHLVAVKTIKGETSDSQMSQMLEESVKMKDFDHPNILNLIGVCITSGSSPYIIMPFMANGSLLSYLKQERHKLTIANGAEEDLVTETQRVLLSICLQIAKGMEYLTSQKFVHRDLAARNCMIDLDNVIKVADFGLSEDVYAKNYYRQTEMEECKVKLPIRWMALESLHDGVFSEKTDVWSYGVTCWEVFTLGKIPYPGVTPFSLIKHLDEGGRLEKPSNAACSDEIYGLMMRRCWNVEPEGRPSFSDLVLAICGILEPLAGYVDFKLPINEGSDPSSNHEDLSPPPNPIIIIEDTTA